jgi:hypothetical protein
MESKADDIKRLNVFLSFSGNFGIAILSLLIDSPRNIGNEGYRVISWAMQQV